MEVVKQSAIMEPSAIGTGTMFSSFANIESMGKVEEQRIANAFLDGTYDTYNSIPSL